MVVVEAAILVDGDALLPQPVMADWEEQLQPVEEDQVPLVLWAMEVGQQVRTRVVEEVVIMGEKAATVDMAVGEDRATAFLA